tara:strand:- start:7421 stop:8092 length:672 start_codon:yes stop_codon:yes gene_type:complete
MPDRLERLKEYEPRRIAGRQKRKSILYQKFQTQGKTDLLQKQTPIKKTGLDPNRLFKPNVLPRTPTFGTYPKSEFKTEGKQSILTSKTIKDRGIKVSSATAKAQKRSMEKKSLGHPKLQGKGQTLTTPITLENISARARFGDWYRSPMKEKNIKSLDAKIKVQNVDHLKQMDKIQKGGIHYDMKGSKSISKGGGGSPGGGGKWGWFNRMKHSPWNLLKNDKSY